MSNDNTPFNDDLYFVEGLQPKPKKEEDPPLPDSGIRLEGLEGLEGMFKFFRMIKEVHWTAKAGCIAYILIFLGMLTMAMICYFYFNK